MVLSNLPSITFAEKSPQKIESSIITTYEGLSGKTLYPGDPIRLFLEAVAAIIIQQRVLIDYSAKQNMLAYAVGNSLDHIGVLVGTDRLQAVAATTTVKFTLSAPQSGSVTIPSGTRVTPSQTVLFATTRDVTILAGATTVDVSMTCTETGTSGNGFTIGQINKLVDPLPWIATVVNITTSNGGSDTETDDAYRERIQQAPEHFSTAGPEGAYQYWAKTASQLITDVAVWSPSAGVVEIRPLLADGVIPTQEILDDVLATCSDKTVRPLTDHVTVLAPTIVDYDVSVSYWIDRANQTSSTSIQTAVAQAVSDYVTWQKAKLARDINPSELTARMVQAGAKRVQITTPIYTALTQTQVAIAGVVSVNYGGLEDG